MKSKVRKTPKRFTHRPLVYSRVDFGVFRNRFMSLFVSDFVFSFLNTLIFYGFLADFEIQATQAVKINGKDMWRYECNKIMEKNKKNTNITDLCIQKEID